MQIGPWAKLGDLTGLSQDSLRLGNVRQTVFGSAENAHKKCEGEETRAIRPTLAIFLHRYRCYIWYENGKQTHR